MKNLTYVTDLSHFVDEDGMIVKMPAAAENLAMYLGSIVAWMTRASVDEVEWTNVRCRRSPGRKRCIGEILADFDGAGEVIGWECPVCGDHGYIHGWRDTMWDRSEMLSAPVALQELPCRIEIARAIAKTERDGLYEAAEHLTSSVDLETDE